MDNQASAKKADAKEDVPESFLCPLTQEVMREPVVDPEGNTYERAAIEAWLEKNSTSPITRKTLRREDLVPNRALRDVIAEHYKSKGLAPPEPLPAAKKPEAPQVGNVSVKITARAAGAPGELEVLVSVIPPAGNKRTPCDICCVVDVSGSMDTEAKLKNEQGAAESHGLSILDVVKHSVKTVVTAMHPDDRIAVVAYSDAAKIVFPLAKMDAPNKEKVLKAVDALVAGGSTNLWDGLHKGLELLRPEATPGRLSSLLLLTDGLPNISPPRGEVPMLQRYIDQNKQLSCVISTFGFGYEINSELLRDLANVGGGMYAFIPDASFVGTAFVNAVSNLLTTMARDLVLSIEPQNGAKLAEANGGLYGAHTMQATSWGASVNLRSMQCGQSKDLVLRLVNAPAAGVYVSVGVQHDLGSSEQPHKMTVDGSDRTGGADVVAQRLRLQFVERVHEAMECARKDNYKGASDIVAALASAISASEAANADAIKKGLLVDVTGQMAEAVSKAEFYKKWGRHYLPSLARAHQLQQCNNFKDPGVQYYGGALFKSERDNVDEIFCKLPPPKPSARRPAQAAAYGHAAPGAAAAAAPRPAPVSSMRVYHNRSAPCFAGSSLARMADGSLRPVAALRKGDLVYTPESAATARIACVIKTLCPSGRTPLVRLSDALLITPYHPVRRAGVWAFPCDLAAAEERECDAVYSFVLDAHHVMVIGGEECVALGHDFTSPVVAHPYFGSKRILHDLEKLPGFDLGLVVFAAPAMVRDERLGLVTGLVPDVLGA